MWIKMSKVFLTDIHYSILYWVVKSLAMYFLNDFEMINLIFFVDNLKRSTTIEYIYTYFF